MLAWLLERVLVWLLAAGCWVLAWLLAAGDVGLDPRLWAHGF